MSLLELKNLGFTYQKGMPDEHKAVQDVNLCIEAGQFVGIIGHTGSGKSTLIQMLNGLLKPTSGEVLINGENIWKDTKTILKTRFTVGLVMQYPEYQLFEESVYKDIAFGPKNMGLSDDEIRERVLETCSYLGLSDDILEKSPFDLSGGQKRRVAIAGILAMKPQILVLDEPTAGLDPRGRKELLSLIDDYHKRENNTVLFVSHSMDDVAAFSDMVLVMNQSRVFCFDTVQNVFSRSIELNEMGLNIPSVTEILVMLKHNGFDVDTSIYRLNDAVSMLIQRYQEGGLS